MKKKLRVLVCGTKFGHVYLSAFAKANDHFELAGILAGNSARSRQYAVDFDVPLYHNVEEVPDDVDIACVVIRSTIVGGAGSEITYKLLEKGVHVIQEHPVHYDDLVRCIRLARKHNVCYRLNTHHVNAAPVRLFADYMAQAAEKGEMRFINATGGAQVVCSLLDIIGHFLGGFRPFAFSEPVGPDENILNICNVEVFPYQVIQGAIGGVPVTLKIQNYYDPDDPDNHAAILHRICAGTSSGNLTLLNTNGPVIWSDEFFIDYKNDENKGEGYHFSQIARKMGASQSPSAVAFSEPLSPSVHDIVNDIWPDAIMRELERMRESIETNEFFGREQYYLDLCDIWRKLMSLIGNPKLVNLHAPDKPCPDPEAYRNSLGIG